MSMAFAGVGWKRGVIETVVNGFADVHSRTEGNLRRDMLSKGWCCHVLVNATDVVVGEKSGILPVCDGEGAREVLDTGIVCNAIVAMADIVIGTIRN